jgi:hypothetical protein
MRLHRSRSPLLQFSVVVTVFALWCRGQNQLLLSLQACATTALMAIIDIEAEPHLPILISTRHVPPVRRCGIGNAVTVRFNRLGE